jgi:hypothetical protein
LCLEANSISDPLNRASESRQPESVGNITLDGNLYDRARIGYAHPRIIALIPLGEGEGVNFFPTDLRGSFGEQHYVSSSRVTVNSNGSTALTWVFTALDRGLSTPCTGRDYPERCMSRSRYRAITSISTLTRDPGTSSPSVVTW